MEQADVDSLATDVAGHRLKHGVTRCGNVGVWALRIWRCNGDVQHCVQSVKLQDVVMKWACSRRSRPSISEATGADLFDLVFKLEPVGSSGREIGRRRWNVPQKPMSQSLRRPRNRRAVW